MKTKKILIISGIIVFLGLAAAVSLGTYQLFAVELASKPSVQFLQPLHKQSVSLGGSLVRFIARDKEGIEHVELWVDGELYASKKSELPQGSTPFPLVEMWQPDSAGQHVLTARAYNSKNRDTVASVVVQVSEETIVKELPMGLPPGDEGAEIPAPGDGVPPGDTGAEVPAAEEEEVEEYVPMLDYSIPIQPLEGFLSEPVTPILDMISRFKLPGGAAFEYTAILLEVEALSLETDRAYDGVACYFSLNDSTPERVPESIPGEEANFIEADEGNFWDIQSLLGGDNKRIVYVDVDSEGVAVFLSCVGFDIGDPETTAYDLGKMDYIYSMHDWDGSLLWGRVYGNDGWFDLSFTIRIAMSEDDLLPQPILQFSEHGNLFDFMDSLYWVYPEEAMELIDGYIIMANDNLMKVIDDPREQGIMLYAGENDLGGMVPPCGQTYTYQVYAFQGDPIFGVKSPPSNPVSTTSPPCYQCARVTFDQLYLICLNGDATIFNPHDCGSGNSGDMNIEYYLDRFNDPAHDVDYENYMGCSYGNFWANDKKFNKGGGNFCIGMADDSSYVIYDIPFADGDELWLPLEYRDFLTIGMNWYDMDTFNDDRMCDGEYIFSFYDLNEIASQPGRKMTFHKYFNERGGGKCGMTFTIHLLEEPPPSDE